VIHSFADDELKSARAKRDTWGAAWRQRDLISHQSGISPMLGPPPNIKLVTLARDSQHHQEVSSAGRAFAACFPRTLFRAIFSMEAVSFWGNHAG